MRVRLSGTARGFILREAAYLRSHGPSAGRAFEKRMQQARSVLAEHPEIGRKMDALSVSNVRQFVTGDYVLTYRSDKDMITILTIRHGRQEPPKLPDEPDTDYEQP